MTTERVREKLLEAGDYKAYPAWFTQILARRLLLILLPERISSNLPRWLSLIIAGEISGPVPPGFGMPRWIVPPTMPSSFQGFGITAPSNLMPFSPGPPSHPRNAPPTPNWTANLLNDQCTDLTDWTVAVEQAGAVTVAPASWFYFNTGTPPG